MRTNRPKRVSPARVDQSSHIGDRDTESPLQQVPPAVIGFLLLFVVVLACAFYVAAQLVVTP